MNTPSPDHAPRPDPAEYGAFFPSPYSLSQFTAPRSDLAGASYPGRYTGGRWKVLVIAADERYLPLANGTLFSTGNHPIEMLLPMIHLDAAGFEMDIATLSGNAVKLEQWAMPQQDEAVQAFYARYLPRLRQPLKLDEVVAQRLGADSDYLAVFIPGGHGALIGLPGSRDVKAVLDWALAQDKHLISLCHGPAALLAAGEGRAAADYPLKGYRICAFPDAMDRQTPAMGYMPGQLTWFFGERLQALGVELVNQDISGATHQDRKLLTGDSPLASNRLGQLAAQALLAEVARG